jgi:hypothetical protein
MKGVKLVTLSEFQGNQARPINDIKFRSFGKTDIEVFASNLFEVMQFVFNHTSFAPDDEIDQGILAVYKHFGIDPGKAYDPAKAPRLDGAQFRRVAEEVARENFAMMDDAEAVAELIPY